MIHVELIYDNDCPNVNDARAQLQRALTKTNHPARWKEWERGDSRSPAYAKSFGSPTILINGHDVAGEQPASSGNCCRVYPDQSGRLERVPSLEMISAAITATNTSQKQKSSWGSLIAALPATGAALLPNLTCPACWPAYAGLLNSMGLGFINYSPYLFPLSAFFMILAVGSLAFRAKRRRGYKPLLLGILAGGLVVASKFLLASTAIMYGGIALLIAASIWNTWPRHFSKDHACSSCETKNL